MANFFWVGGTGANVAMAYARMLYLGLIDFDDQVNDQNQHLFIDTPENLNNAHIGLNTFGKIGAHSKTSGTDLKLWDSTPAELSVSLMSSGATFTTFGDFLITRPGLAQFYKGFPSSVIKTPVQHGNYYNPCVGATMASVELDFDTIESRIRPNDMNILCGSCYGGTGSGVIPVLADWLISKNKSVKIVYLNRWILDNKKDAINDIAEANEASNIQYLKELKNRNDRLEYFNFNIDDDKWVSNPPTGINTNTLNEIPNPFPYLIANCIAQLLLSAPGDIPPYGSFRISIQKEEMPRNPAFVFAYAYLRLAHVSDGLIDDYSFVTSLMQDDPRWNLRRLIWDPAVFKHIQSLEQGRSNVQEVRANILNFCKKRLKGKTHFFDWTGFMVKNSESESTNKRIESFPSIFAGYYFFKHNFTDHRDAYLALLALIITKRVYCEWDTEAEKLGFTRQVGCPPIRFSNVDGPIGYTCLANHLIWPLRGAMSRLENLLKTDIEVKSAIRTLGNQLTLGNNNPLLNNNFLRGAVDHWIANNSDHDRTTWITMEFFKPHLPLDLNAVQSMSFPLQVSKITYTNNNILFNYANNQNLSIDCNDHSLLVNDGVIHQLVDVMPLDGKQLDRKLKHIIPSEYCNNNYLVLSTDLVLDLSGVAYGRQIVHPSFILPDNTVRFALGSGNIVPWPVRKQFIDCISLGSSVHPVEITIEDSVYVDMHNNQILNWEKPQPNDKDSSNPFLVYVEESETLKYQGCVWPYDRQTSGFLHEWRFYSVRVVRQLTTQSQSIAQYLGIQKDPEKDEQWFLHADGKCLSFVGDSRGTRMVSCMVDNPPTGLSFEIANKGELIATGYFKLPSSSSVGNKTLNQVDIGLDFGTVSTCAASKDSEGNLHKIRMNPADHIYKLFEHQDWEENNIEQTEWVPFIDVDKNPLFLSSLYSLHELKGKNWGSLVKLEVQDNDPNLLSIQLKDNDTGFVNAKIRLPLQDFTIPGERLQDVILNDNEFCIHNLKWADTAEKRLIYWHDYLTTYILFLSAHVYINNLGQHFKNQRFNQINLRLTFPLKFTLINDLKLNKINGTELTTNLEKAFKGILNSVATTVTEYTGINISCDSFVYEAVASIPENIVKDQIQLVIDVGGGSTDIAVFEGIDNKKASCIAVSSFVYGGQNPVRTLSTDYIRNIDGYRELPDTQVVFEAFIDSLCTYTALFVGAMIKQKGNRCFDNLKVYLLGRSWQLARFHRQCIGSKSDQDQFVKRLISQKILQQINGPIYDELKWDHEGVSPLDSKQIDFRVEDSLYLKYACAYGALTSASLHGDLPSINNLPFMGLSYISVQDGKKYSWHDTSPRQAGLHNAKDIILSGISPALLMMNAPLKERLDDKFRSFESAATKDGIIKVNVLEYLLSQVIGVDGKLDHTTIKSIQ